MEKREEETIDITFETLLDVLPQTQCRQCGFDGCAPYAKAILDGTAEINQCPPGGQVGIDRIAALLNRSSVPLNLDHGVEAPRVVAVIQEATCIGCTLCIQACPVDAIMGSAKQMHTVVEDYCTGCRLCVPPCPMDCIELAVVEKDKTGWQAWSQAQAQQAKHRFEARERRLKKSEKKSLSPPEHFSSLKAKPSENKVYTQPISGEVIKNTLVQNLVKKALDRANHDLTRSSVVVDLEQSKERFDG
jgi:electron transport complex protein RnfB